MTRRIQGVHRGREKLVSGERPSSYEELAARANQGIKLMPLPTQTPGPKKSRRTALLIGLLMLAFLTMGSGTCVVVEEDPYGDFEEPGINEERMEEQEIDVIDESNR